jgi:hypothetical protein
VNCPYNNVIHSGFFYILIFQHRHKYRCYSKNDINVVAIHLSLFTFHYYSTLSLFNYSFQCKQLFGEREFQCFYL